MDSPISSNNLSENILKEIELLPVEFKNKSNEIKNLQTELNELKTKYVEKENQMNKITKEIFTLENNITHNYEALSNAKSEQKLIINEIDDETFEEFRNNFYKIDKSYRTKILCFLKYEDKFEEELNFLLLKTDNLHSLLSDSYSFFKSLEETDKEKFQLYSKKLINNKTGNNIKLNFNKDGIKIKNKLPKSFDLIFNFIENTFKIIDINRKIQEMKTEINYKNDDKGKLFIEIKILENSINEKQENLKNINIYIKKINNILIKYKNFFQNHNNSININKANNSIKNNNNENDNNFGKKILYLKNNINDSNILISNNKIINSNLNNSDNNSNNFYYAVNNCSKNKIVNKSNSYSDNLSSNTNPNNVKIISINNSNQSSDNPKISNFILKSNKNYNQLNRNRINDNLSQSNQDSNQKEGKKIKIGSLALYQSSTAKKFKNKAIKANSYDKDDIKKIYLHNSVPISEQNKSYNNYDDLMKDENIENESIEKNSPRTNPKLNQSFKLIEEKNNKENKSKNINKLKNINEKKIKNENNNDRETIVENYNNNFFVEYNNNNENSNKDFNKTKILYPNSGVYNNNRKIFKVNEKTKNNNKNK